MKPCVIFDLDGVIVESLEFERTVGDLIVQLLSQVKRMLPAEAKRLWHSTLRGHIKHPRWHDYALHCSSLGLDDEWKTIHRQLRGMIHPLPRMLEAIQVGRRSGNCWLASDATDWVVEFKLDAVGLDVALFDEVFTLDRCRVSKGHHEYWAQVRDCVVASESHLIYVDNRLDRLASAAEVLRNCRLVHVIAEDHPTSLGLFSDEILPSGGTATNVTSEDLPTLLHSLVSAI